MRNVPTKVFIQIGDPDDIGKPYANRDLDFYELHEPAITHSFERIFSNDLCYYLKTKTHHKRKYNKKLSDLVKGVRT